ncbi:MAG: TIM barrel protein [Candidatus Acidiferrum sp.]|jgi:L-rhamnose isomerase/sugar isomerase
MKDRHVELVWSALDKLSVELPSWGFANTGTRFGKFIQPAAASSIEEKFSDAAQVHAVTGACPTLALHVQWDMPNGLRDVPKVEKLAKEFSIRPGSINPNIFQNQEYKYGSVGNPDPGIRRMAIRHILDCVAISEALGAPDISPWFADGSNYPGTQNIRNRITYFEEGLREIHAALKPGQRLLLEYKPFEPAFYHTDIADWGMALLLAKGAGPQALVLVDTGHHYQAQNIEQIVAWLLHHKMMGGFHFNDRRYADDDLTLGSIDPYQIFRIFHEIRMFEWETQTTPDIAYMVDQSHNLKGKIEAMIQTVCTAQELYARAALVDHARLAKLQQDCSLVDAEETLRGAFWQDVRPAIQEWRKSHNLPEDPLQAFRNSGYLERITAERSEKNRNNTATYA